jgi:hypothetical protein
MTEQPVEQNQDTDETGDEDLSQVEQVPYPGEDDAQDEVPDGDR